MRTLTGLLCAALVSVAQATNHLLRMDEILAALQGDPTVQFIEISVSDNGQKDWGPQAGETESRAMLVFFDGNGNQTAVFKFPNDPPGGGNTVLIATAAFTARTGLRADILMPPLLHPGSGKVCFRGNPANPSSFAVNLCLSYGSFPPGQTEGAGPPAPALPATGQPTSLARFQNFSFGDSTSRNADFILGSPSPVNTSGETINFPVAGPEISVAPALVAFGNRDVAIGPTLPRTITITSLGSSNPLVIASVTLIGPGADQFRILSDSGQAVLGPNSNRLVTVEFDPTTVGSKTATLRIACNDSDERTVDVLLQGGGIDTNPCAAPDPAVAVAQDVCVQAQLIGPAITYSGSLVDANSDGFSSCVLPGSVDMWFRYVASSNGVLTVSASASGALNVGLSAHSGCPGTSFNQFACFANLNSVMQQRFQMNVTAGAAVLLRFARVVNEFPPNQVPPVTFQLLISGPPAFDFDQNRNGVNDPCEFDFGDAPAPYPTSLAANGARHRALTGLFLGQRVDSNTNGLPSAGATGDNLDGPANDDDGITWDTTLQPARQARYRAVASSNGFLNAWIDYNADGDWSDVGEQILTNRLVVAGANVFLINVPANAVVTNQTFARFRLNSTGGLGVTGSAPDGEVEDYAVPISDATSFPVFSGVAINEVMAGLNGDSSIQFVELTVESVAFSRDWGPPAGGTNGRAMLAFFDASGRQTGRFVFPSNAPAAGSNILVATRAFAERTGLTPDFLMPPELIAVAGKVAFRPNPDSPFFVGDAPLSYGGVSYFGPTDKAGPANMAALPILGATSLHRVSSSPSDPHRNDEYQLGPPTPENAAGQTVSLTVAPLVEQGRVLFTKETFNGNGRTCFTCHRAGSDQFGLTPATIAALPDSDPLFVFEDNVNVLRLATRSQPSDLRGRITGSSGSAEILAGSGDTYLVIGGGQLSGVIADTNGNSGAQLDFTLGNLEGPTPSNGSERGLEDHEMLRHGRGLILENIDGFAKREVFRTSPHLLNIAQTAPYGLSGEFANLRDFSAGAVAQHFPRSMARVSGKDFREPTAEELVAMEAFQNSIVNPANGDLSLDRFVTTEAQKRGRALFFSNEAKCSKCHSGPTLSQSDGTLPGSLADVNEDFDTGVANLVMNGPSGSNLPSEPAGLARSTRKFNTPPLFGIRLSAPFFHDGSATNLRAAVEFYDDADFAISPSGPMTGSMPAVNDTNKLADLVAFLESLVEIPVGFTREATFGIQCAPTPDVISVGVANLGTNMLVISNLAFLGPNPGDFHIATDSGETSLAPGQARLINIGFTQVSQGSKRATLEFTAADPDIPGPIRFATALSGALVDNVVTAGPAAVGFTARGIADAPSTARLVSVTNAGSGPLEFVRVSLTGTHPADFRIVSDSAPTNLPPGGVRTLGIAFAPQARGARSALLRIESIACSGAVIDVPLSGTATSTFDHFEWAPIPSTQGFNVAFPVRISAVDRNGELITDFTNTVSLSAASGSNPINIPVSTIVITELDAGTPDAVEFMNVSSAPVDVSGWQVHLIDQVAITTPLTFAIPPNSVLQPGGIFTLNEGGTPPGAFPNLFGGFNISWIASFTNLAVQVRNVQGNVVDFATGSAQGAGVFINPSVPISEWSGPGFTTPSVDSLTSYQRIGNSDGNSASDWIIAPLSMGVLNPGLSAAFATPTRVIAISPSNTTSFVGGIWTGEVTVRTEGVDIRLTADDNAGHSSQSGAFSVVGTPPTISVISNQTTFEDALSPLVSFNVNDSETSPSALIVTATSSNATLVGPSGILMGGSGTQRTLRVRPATNQFGTAFITVQVSDGSSSATQSFTLTVLSVNDLPVVLPVGNRVVTERTAVSINVLTFDPDLPNDTLIFSLPQSPAGATIDAASGVIQWFPSELQGGSSFNFSVSVRDASVGPPSVTNFLVQVLKVNSPPTLNPVLPQTVYAGGLLRFTNTALDLDLPTNTLTFSLATNVPGAIINPTSGVLTWTPLISQVGLNVLNPVVRDNNQPPLSATQAVLVTVLQPPMGFTTNADFGVNCVGAPPSAPRLIGITNIGTTNLVLLATQFSGTNLAEFPIVSDTRETNLAPGAVRLIEVGFVPLSFGRKAATFSISATARDPLGAFSFNIPLTGAFVDNTVAVNVTAVDFGARSIDAPQSPAQTISVTNLGLGPLQIDTLIVSITNAFEFILLSDTGGNPLPPGGTRHWQFAFSPQSRGTKSARLILDALACSGGHVEIPLTGVGTSTLDHFGMDPIAATQNVSVPFPVRLTALDRNNQAVTDFAGPVALSATVTLPAPPPRIVIAEIDPGTPDAVEFVNVSGIAQNLTNWQVSFYDEASFSGPIISIALNGIVPSNGLFTVTEGGFSPGVFPNFFAGVNLFWQGVSTNLAVLLRDNLGFVVDFATTGDRTRIFNPLFISTNQWSGAGIPAEAVDEVSSYHRGGLFDRNDVSDWIVGPRSIGIRNPALTAPFPTNRVLEISPAVTGTFTDGVWAGSVGVLEEANQVRLEASDGSGHVTLSELFVVRGAPPFLSNFADQTLDEDTVTPVIPFTVSDPEQPLGTLVVTAVSSNVALVPDAGLILGGTGNARTLRIVPSPNASGVTTITVSVSDGTQTTIKSFRVTVNPVPDRPFIAFIDSRQVNELQPLALTVSVTDPDPGTRLTFTLISPPAGAVIHPTNGNFSWTPSEAQGPTNALLIVRVADDGVPSLTATQSFVVSVFEVNQPPVFPPISNRVIHVGNTLNFTIPVTDPDIPTNTHSFSLVQGPPGATVDSFGGRFSFTPSPLHVGSNFLVRVRAIDSGGPSLGATQSFNILVLALPIGQPAAVDFGSNCPGAFPLPTRTVTFRNLSASPVAISSLMVGGPGAEEFFVSDDTGQSVLVPGQTRTVGVGFNPVNAGTWIAGLTLTGTQQQGTFTVSVSLTGMLLDNTAVVAPTVLDFGNRDIELGISSSQFFTLTNLGSVNLAAIRVGLSAGDTNDFQLTSDTGPPNPPPGGTRTFGVAFRPTQGGSRAATLTVESAACSNATLQVALAGRGISGLHHFVWDAVPSTQLPGVAFSVRARAVDRNEQLATDFNGTVSLSAMGSMDVSPAKPVLITEIDIGMEAVEFMNVSGRNVDLSRWRVLLYESPVAPVASVTIPLGSVLGSNTVFTVTRAGTAPGALPFLFTGTIVNWPANSTNLSVVFLDAEGALVDFATLGSSTAITNPIEIPAAHWRGSGIPPTAAEFSTSYQRQGFVDRNDSSDWIVAPRSFGSPNPGLAQLFLNVNTNAMVHIAPTNSTAFVAGEWSGTVTLLDEARAVRLKADDGTGHIGLSDPIDVLGQPPSISDIADRTVDEDTPIPTVTFNVGDDFVPETNLIVFARSSDTNLLSNSRIALLGSGASRDLRVTPATNQSGSTIITVTVSDGAQTNSDTFLLTVRPANDPPVMQLSSGFAEGFRENFDNVSLPGLPPGWVATSSAGLLFRTVNDISDTPPNAVFIRDSAQVTDNSLTSPSIQLGPVPTNVTFRHSFSTESCCDGGFLEVSINGSVFSNVTALGWIFTSGAYNSQNNSWRGLSSGFITTTLALPPALANQTLRFRWRFTSDSSVDGPGWWIDSIVAGSTASTNRLSNEDEPVIITVPVSDAESPASALVLNVASSNPDLVPPGNIQFGGTESVRVVTVTPATNQSGIANLTLTLSDGELTVTQVVTLTILPVNDPPVVTPVPDQFIDEGTTLVLRLTATDPDLGTNQLTFSPANMPGGATIDQLTGVITWTPSEFQQGFNDFAIMVSDNGNPPQGTTHSFKVLVREVNSAPELGPALSDTVYPGFTISRRFIASDPDVPANQVRFDLLSFPLGASIDPFTGQFDWSPGVEHVGTSQIIVQATDNGLPPLSDTTTFTVNVLAGPTFRSLVHTGNGVILSWHSLPGFRYRVQFTDQLPAATWTDLPGDVTATSTIASKVNVTVPPTQRFYRIQVMPQFVP